MTPTPRVAATSLSRLLAQDIDGLMKLFEAVHHPSIRPSIYPSIHPSLPSTAHPCSELFAGIKDLRDIFEASFGLTVAKVGQLWVLCELRARGLRRLRLNCQSSEGARGFEDELGRRTSEA